ncbi:MAG TPA: cation diffusion facilitator family transporter [Defluviitoga sp.]|nr:cation diffusion facilitator family transporter [Defluviitoga sp.]HOP24840.1 cation diffusion facilitator family transporter [Defluviitoga sp.]HPZ28250.1 cation diffusion facilitator family transporter [Defluviitoga sp.]HQD62140.1 cation diffusion facilitator family transporter [Defluviitoga sp.]
MKKVEDSKNKKTDSKLLFSVVLNLGITSAEIVGGILSHSLALLSDAFHNLNDTLAILISFIANILSKKQDDSKRTYGYKRFEVLAAFVNTLFLMVISVFLFIEGIKNVFNPNIVTGNIMLSVAVVGLVGNLITVFLLFKDSKKNLNIKALFIHILSDTISSVFVIIGAFLIIFKNLYIIDPIFTFIISGYIFFESIPLLKETVNILLQGAPDNIEIQQIKTEIEKLPFIKDVHHIHLWTTDGEDKYLEAHIRLSENFDNENYDLDKCIDTINSILKDKFEINHSTLQFERNRCLEESVQK